MASLVKLDWRIGNSPMWKFCIRKLPIGRSGATSKIGLEHKEFSYKEILHREIPYWQGKVVPLLKLDWRWGFVATALAPVGGGSLYILTKKILSLIRSLQKVSNVKKPYPPSNHLTCMKFINCFFFASNSCWCIPHFFGRKYN